MISQSIGLCSRRPGHALQRLRRLPEPAQERAAQPLRSAEAHLGGDLFDPFASGFDALARRFRAQPLDDPYLFTLAQWLEADGCDPSRLPRVTDHHRRMAERPAVRRAIAAVLGSVGTPNVVTG